MSTSLLAIDPALRALGWAFFKNGTLVLCGVARSKEKYPAFDMAMQSFGVIGTIDVVILEVPQAYPGNPVPAQDLIDIAVVGAYVAGINETKKFIQVAPRKWKGNLPKDETERRSREVMTKDELETVAFELKDTPKGLHNNAWDAIALGLWQLRRVQLA